jgi:hypothetical protein
LLRASPECGRKAWIIVLAMMVLILGVPIATFAQTQTLTLAWDSSSQAIDHFNVYIGTQPGVHNVGVQSVPGFQPAYSFTVTPGTLLFFAVSAVDTDGLESQLSTELKCAVPILVQPPNQTGTAGVAVPPLVLTASDPGGGQLQFAATGLPAGLMINGATGVISGTPTTAGTGTVTVSVNNGVVTTTQSFTWTIAAAPVVTTVTLAVNPSSGSGATGTFTAQYTDTLGAADLGAVYLKFSTASSGTSSECTLSFIPSTNQLSLRDDAGTVWQSAAIGSGTLQNSQCTVDLVASSASSSGQTLGVTVAVAFTAAYAGSKNIYSYATTVGGLHTGWTTAGSWTIPSSSSIPALSTISVTPSDGFGAAQTFTAKFMGAAGAANIAAAYVKFSAVSNGAVNTCIVGYDRASHLLSLRDDAGDWQPGGAPGAAEIQRNTQCRLLLAGSSIVSDAQTLTLKVAMKFSPSYAGEKNVYLRATSMSGMNVGWRRHSSWTVPSGPEQSISNGSLAPDSGMGTTQIFSARYYDAPSGDTVAKAYLRFSATLNGAANTCALVYDRQTHLLSLRDDAGDWQQALPVSVAGSLQNSQCLVSLAETSASFSNSVLTLNVAVTFKPSYDGPKNAYLNAMGTSGAATGWELRGSWSIPSSGPNAHVSAGTVTPNSGSGATQTFTAQFMDTLGANDLAVVYVKVSGQPRGPLNTCMIRYEPATGVSLRDDDGQWLPGISTNAVGQQQNTQCAMSVGAGSVTTSGNTLTLSVTLTFNPPYQGAKNVYLHATTIDDYVTDWQQRGTWIVP